MLMRTAELMCVQCDRPEDASVIRKKAPGLEQVQTGRFTFVPLSIAMIVMHCKVLAIAAYIVCKPEE